MTRVSGSHKHIKYFQGLAASYIKKSRFIDNKDEKVFRIWSFSTSEETSNYLLSIGVSITDVLQMIGKTIDEYEG